MLKRLSRFILDTRYKNIFAFSIGGYIVVLNQMHQPLIQLWFHTDLLAETLLRKWCMVLANTNYGWWTNLKWWMYYITLGKEIRVTLNIWFQTKYILWQIFFNWSSRLSFCEKFSSPIRNLLRNESENEIFS